MSPVQPSSTDICYIIPISITFVNFNMFYIHEVPDIMSLLYYLDYIIHFSITLINISIFRIHKIAHII
jgi:hypothetical protein